MRLPATRDPLDARFSLKHALITVSAWDEIIVGAGAAGSVLAGRLSTDHARRVLLIEAGPDYPDPQALPSDLRLARAMSFVDHDWDLVADAGEGRPISYPRGKVVGGSSAVNATVALRGMPHDYDDWERTGCAGWAWTDVLPYFRKLETDADFADSELHGSSGPVYIRRLRRSEWSASVRAFFDTCRTLGYDEVTDHNDPRQSGVGPLPLNQRDGVRQSAALCYLAPARGRPNLSILPNALAVRVLFESRRAVGVEVLRDGRVERFEGARITLSAGAIHTPGILFRSGIGPAAELRALGIDVVADRPGVGQNLSDHPSVGIPCVPRPGGIDPERPHFQVYARYTASGSAEPNDMQLGITAHFDLRPRSAYLVDLVGTPTPLLVFAQLERVRSRGRLILSNTDALAPPGIVLEYAQDPEDLRRLLDGMRRAWQVATSEPLAPFIERISILSQSIVDDDDQLAGVVKLFSQSGFHPVGTAKMGPPADTMAVVDERLRVHGIEGLCVVDASVMPGVPSANTNLPTMMIAERAAELMRS